MVQPRQWDGSGLVFFKSNLEHFRAPEVWEGREYLHSVVPLLIGLRTELGVKRMRGTGAAAAVVEGQCVSGARGGGEADKEVDVHSSKDPH